MAKKRKTSLGCLFWVALILLILVIFLFNREAISTVLENTNFLDIVTSSPESPTVVDRSAEEESTQDSQGNQAENTREPEEAEPIVIEPTAQQVDPESIVTEEQAESQEAPAQRVRQARLYFITVEDDGNIGLKAVVRPVPYTSSPLTQTLNALLSGLTAGELNSGLISLIPEKTNINRIFVQNDIAHIDLSSDFTINTFGREGYLAQLKQFVYTATEFPTVTAVQFLISGEQKQFLGGDGIMIDKPLSRSSF